MKSKKSKCNHCGEQHNEGTTICSKCRCGTCKRITVLCECNDPKERTEI